MDQKTRQLEKRIADQYREIATLEDTYDTLAAHSLYERLREAGFKRVEIHIDPDSMWVENSDTTGHKTLMSNERTPEAQQILDDWLDDYPVTSAERLIRQEGRVFDTSKDPYGVSHADAITQRDQILQAQGLSTEGPGVDHVARGAHISKTLSDVGGIPADEITDASTADEMLVGIGPLNEEDQHPYVLRSNGETETELRAHAPDQPGGDRLVETYNTDEANALVENVTYDIRVDIDEVDREQRLREQQTALNQLPNTQAGVAGPGIG